MKFSARNLLPLLAVLLIFLADLASKLLAQQYLTGPDITVIPFLLDLRLIFNSGIALGFFADSPQWFGRLIALASILLTCLGIYQVLRPHSRQLTALAWVCFTAGALGNVWERLLYGQVTDFLFLHLHTLPLFIFNLADASLTFAVMLFLLDEFFRFRNRAGARAA